MSNKKLMTYNTKQMTTPQTYNKQKQVRVPTDICHPVLTKFFHKIEHKLLLDIKSTYTIEQKGI